MIICLIYNFIIRERGMCSLLEKFKVMINSHDFEGNRMLVNDLVDKFTKKGKDLTVISNEITPN